jgi:hypothetical protein
MKNKNSKSIIKHYTPEEAKKIVGYIFATDSDTDTIFRKLAEEVLPKLMAGNDEEQRWAKDHLLFRSEDAVMAMGFVNHYHLIPTADKQYAPLILNMTKQIEKDYNCCATDEKALAAVIAMAYIKIVDSSRMFSGWYENKERPSWDTSTKHLEMLSRQMDRANRQFLSAIAMLKQIKQPPIEVNIRTKNAFVAQTQQINADKKQS